MQVRYLLHRLGIHHHCRIGYERSAYGAYIDAELERRPDAKVFENRRQVHY